jgi:hypothetical protein
VCAKYYRVLTHHGFLFALSLLVAGACTGDARSTPTGPAAFTAVDVQSPMPFAAPGQTVDLFVRFHNDIGTPFAITSLRWVSSDTSVMTVSQTGEGLARAPGAVTLSAIVNDTATGTLAFSVKPTGGFTITVRIVRSVSPTVLSAVNAAVARWSGLLNGPVSPVAPVVAAGACGDNTLPALNGESTQQLFIFVQVANLGGEDIAGVGGACVVRDGAGLPLLSTVTLNAVSPALNDEVVTTKIVEHEIAHALGFGNIDSFFALSSSGADPRFLGTNANNQANLLKLPASIMGTADHLPLDDRPNETVVSHWRLDLLPTELMSPVMTTGLLTTMTLGAMADLGYQVNYARADSWSAATVSALQVIQPGGATHSARPVSFDNDILTPLWRMNDRGVMERIRR